MKSKAYKLHVPVTKWLGVCDDFECPIHHNGPGRHCQPYAAWLKSRFWPDLEDPGLTEYAINQATVDPYVMHDLGRLLRQARSRRPSRPRHPRPARS